MNDDLLQNAINACGIDTYDPTQPQMFTDQPNWTSNVQNQGNYSAIIDVSRDPRLQDTQKPSTSEVQYVPSPTNTTDHRRKRSREISQQILAEIRIIGMHVRRLCDTIAQQNMNKK